MKIKSIIDMEWEMMQAVNNIGGRAHCQDDYETFYIMRYSQWKTMGEAVIDSYHYDLLAAKSEGRNLVTEKYAYMMEFTDKKYYDEMLKPYLPCVADEDMRVIYEITDKLVEAEQAFAEKYPRFSSAGRASVDDSFGASIRTYAVGELKTYSRRTLEEYLTCLSEMEAECRNPAYETRKLMSEMYGYKNLDEAEESLK